ncbi:MULTISPECIES: hypothetical protein [Desulfococcus]|jgi:Fe-S-cluster containining protein|uniref:YkgJ family cysteine cluster protein n=1 Tax=Desulfococcus multivorans DSM 2059 TaxID=1121405 RepID=S7UU95_DESML|nr:hypothetical protein [Desulfococcus multivorans]AOY59920.1 conserved uncharacterized protein, associated to Fe-S cluster protein [Desulfococcus multivorans]AQV02073.1 hypothetical protein B2D07_15760 [Desulfococcus multivorans]EPR35918.1 hypothetical protein dsmv_0623 [Desulfococcus multivorans DSM 2059]MDX9818169.1 hypothetical protein [Desulfococcus multivorans]SJZ35115.1 hypothetical protein SAMN02745446_00139 [Desulfococcus multivorans DSM 2059]
MTPTPDITAPFIGRLKTLYADMDAAYRKAADHYGFHCRGCEDNCCLTRFFHHTHLEHRYLREGFRRLPDALREEIRERADLARQQTAAAEKEGAPPRIMCPLNGEGWCRLYDYRPMICRLHGIAHEVHPPGRPAFRSPGCAVFSRRAAGRDDFRFDRTPFYRAMALLENELRQAAGITVKLKMTVADMIATFEDRPS